MDIDSLKNTWADYEKKLSKSLQLNEKLLKEINLKNTKKGFGWLIIYEYLNIALLIFLIILSVKINLYYADYLQYSIPGIIYTTIVFLYVYFSIIRLKHLKRIDFSDTLMKVQRQLAKSEKQFIKFKKYELLCLPLFILPFFPIVLKYFFNINIYNSIGLLIFEIVFSLGLGYPTLITLYKRTYHYKYKKAEKVIQELNEIESEVNNME